MARFDPAQYAAPVRALLGEPRLMSLAAARPNQAAFDQLRELDETTLLDGRPVRDHDMARACLAGLWLYHDFLDEAHRISQGLRGREGSYWHGIVHRREGDYANAKYWFRRVGAHPIHEALNAGARTLARDAGADAAFPCSQAPWDAGAFVDLYEAACTGRSGAADLCGRIQQREWQLLFDYCHRRAGGRR